MTDNGFNSFYSGISSKLNAQFLENPTFMEILIKVYKSFVDKGLEWQINKDGKSLSFSQCHNATGLLKNSRFLKMVDMYTTNGDIVIIEKNSKVSTENIVDDDNQDIDFFITYRFQYFDRDGVELQRCGLSNHYHKTGNPFFFLSFAVMYQELMKYQPAFFTNSLPQCGMPIDKKHSSRYIYTRANDNPAVVACSAEICQEQLDKDILKSYYSDDFLSQLELLNSNSLNSEVDQYTINGHYLSAGNPQYLNFFPSRRLLGEQIADIEFGKKYLIGVIDHLCIKHTNPEIYKRLLDRINNKQKIYEKNKED